MNKDLRCSLFISDIKLTQFSSVTQACPILCDPVNRSRPGLSVQTNSRTSLRLTSIESVMPSSHLILSRPLLLLPPVPPSIRVFSNESNSSHEVAKVLEFQPQHHSFLPKKSQGQSPCSPRDSQESSPTPEFKSSNSSALSLLHSPTLTSLSFSHRHFGLMFPSLPT